MKKVPAAAGPLFIGREEKAAAWVSYSKKCHVSDNHLNISFILLIFVLKRGIIDTAKLNFQIEAMLRKNYAAGNSEHPGDARRKGAWVLFAMGRDRSGGDTVWVDKALFGVKRRIHYARAGSEGPPDSA